VTAGFLERLLVAADGLAISPEGRDFLAAARGVAMGTLPLAALLAAQDRLREVRFILLPEHHGADRRADDRP
jgi:hypothetical protein